MKQLFITLLCILILVSCFENKPLESADHIPLDSISHYYSIQLNEMDSMVEVTFVSRHIADRDKQLSIPNVDTVKINEQILNIENNSYKINIPIQTIKNDLIIIKYFSSDTVFYEKLIKLARFTDCKVVFHANDKDDIAVNFEPALNTFEELDVALEAKEYMHKRFNYNESIRNGISFGKNRAQYYGAKNTRVPVITLKKLYTERYTVPLQLEIQTSTSIQRLIENVPVIITE